MLLKFNLIIFPRYSSFIFSVKNDNNEQSFYRVSVEGSVKFQDLWKEGDAKYDQVRNSFWMNELTFHDGEYSIDHSIIQNISSGKEKCKFLQYNYFIINVYQTLMLFVLIFISYSASDE